MPRRTWENPPERLWSCTVPSSLSVGILLWRESCSPCVFLWTPYVLRGVFYYQKSGQERLVLRLHIPQFSRHTLKVCSTILLRTAHLTIPWKFAESFLTTNCLVGFHYFRKAYLERNIERPLLSPFICHKALNQLTSRSPLCSWSSGGRRVVCRSLSWPIFSVFHCLEGGCDRYQQHTGSNDLYVVTAVRSLLEPVSCHPFWRGRKMSKVTTTTVHQQLWLVAISTDLLKKATFQ